MTIEDKLSTIKPPKHCGRYRRWRIWHDFGHFEHGQCYRETKWRAQSPTGVQIEGPALLVGSYAGIVAEIDRREAAK